jgi:predicted acetyltransferase
LKLLNQMGVERALITCHETNAASARVIEKCGGVRTEDAETVMSIERRYRVPTEL